MVKFGKLLADTIALPFDAFKTMSTGENSISGRLDEIYDDLADEDN